MRDLFTRLVVAAERIADALTAHVQHRPGPRQEKKRRAKTMESRRDELIDKIQPTEIEVARAKKILRGKP